MRNGNGFHYFTLKIILMISEFHEYVMWLVTCSSCPLLFGTEVYAASGKVFRRIWLDTSISHLFVFISPDIWHLVQKMDFITADARM